MWNSFCEAVGTDIDYKILEKSFLNATLDQDMLKLIQKYKKNYLIGMITDNKADRINAVIEKTELNGLIKLKGIVVGFFDDYEKAKEWLFM